MGSSVKSPDNKTLRINQHKAAIETLKRDIERSREILKANPTMAKSTKEYYMRSIAGRQKDIAYHRDCIKHEKSTK
ncbi:MAG: hypothetical protein PUC92_01360 [bacterium]|nr:hypothetical protein [bacterium]